MTTAILLEKITFLQNFDLLKYLNYKTTCVHTGATIIPDIASLIYIGRLQFFLSIVFCNISSKNYLILFPRLIELNGVEIPAVDTLNSL